MQIKIKNNVLAKDAKLCKSFLSQIKGLMFSRQKNIIFEFRKEKKEMVHMFFVFYPIDIILLNKNKEVIEMKQNFKPFTIYNPKNKAKYILELKRDTIKKNKIKINDEIFF